MWCQGRKHDNITCFCLDGYRSHRVVQAFESKIRLPVIQGSPLVDTWHNPGTAIAYRGISEWDPTGQIVLGLDKIVAIVLMPWKFPWVARFFVDRLIPVQACIGT